LALNLQPFTPGEALTADVTNTRIRENFEVLAKALDARK
jgi:hypothetical protein